jgi:hypothetical protein
MMNGFMQHRGFGSVRSIERNPSAYPVLRLNVEFLTAPEISESKLLLHKKGRDWILLS